MKDHEIGRHFGGDFDVTLSQLRVHGMKHVVRVAIIARILLLTRDDDRRPRGFAMLVEKPRRGKGEVVTLWSKIEKNTDKIAIQSFTVLRARE